MGIVIAILLALILWTIAPELVVRLAKLALSLALWAVLLVGAALALLTVAL